MPATVALFAVIRQWIKGEKDLRLISLFWRYYKADFFRANLIWLIYLAVFYVIYVNYMFVEFYYAEDIHFYIYSVIFVAFIVIFMSFVNVFSIMAHYKMKTIQYIKVALGMVFSKPLHTIIQIIWLLVYYIVFIELPKVFLVLGVSVIAFVLLGTNYRIFIKYDQK
ncbi:hypothetical protein AXY_21170 [Amphibacillus xylanus NBRC 15112]|uniref:DUF624 domain-containing protein n=2 Tax=Amphibacillus xylanus TaxID=1449 RepID=K0J0B4_AMPXN|nr:hypothetical protein AXY_21170 [Amphibacillus xylanus NBRC 15112]